MKARHLILTAALSAPVSASANLTVCNQLKSTTAGLTSMLSGAAAALPAALKVTGLMALEHSSGAMIAAAANGTYLPHTLGAVGSVVGVLTTTPAVVVGSTIVLSIGGLYVACSFVKPEPKLQQPMKRPDPKRGG